MSAVYGSALSSKVMYCNCMAHRSDETKVRSRKGLVMNIDEL